MVAMSSLLMRCMIFAALLAAAASSQDRDLNRGRGEARAFAGLSFGRGAGLMDTVAPAAGAEVAVGISRLLAVTGSYSNNNFGMNRLRRHEVMGGIRASAVNRSRVTPYGALTAGAVVASTSTGTGMMGGVPVMMGAATSTGRSDAKFAASPGGGIDCKISRNVGVFLDFRAVKAIDIPWYGRTGAGVFFRWN
jgi:hypothetical protein